MKKLFSIIFSILLFIGFVYACKEDAKPLPYTNVNINIQPNSPLYPSLNTVGGFAMLTANYPSRGVIVYRLSSSQFLAYERTCPHDADACCNQDTCTRLVVESSGLEVIDPCCGSKFLIIDGSVASGPSNYPLKQYAADYDGDILHIYNKE